MGMMGGGPFLQVGNAVSKPIAPAKTGEENEHSHLAPIAMGGNMARNKHVRSGKGTLRSSAPHLPLSRSALPINMAPMEFVQRGGPFDQPTAVVPIQYMPNLVSAQPRSRSNYKCSRCGERKIGHVCRAMGRSASGLNPGVAHNGTSAQDGVLHVHRNKETQCDLSITGSPRMRLRKRAEAAAEASKETEVIQMAGGQDSTPSMASMEF